MFDSDNQLATWEEKNLGFYLTQTKINSGWGKKKQIFSRKTCICVYVGEQSYKYGQIQVFKFRYFLLVKNWK